MCGVLRTNKRGKAQHYGGRISPYVGREIERDKAQKLMVSFPSLYPQNGVEWGVRYS